MFNWWPFKSATKKCIAPFFIFCQERSGSSHLGTTLSSHSDVYCRLENFDSQPLGEASELGEQEFPISTSGSWAYRRLIHKQSTTLKDPTCEQALDYMEEIFAHPALACGFKFKFPTQVDIFPEIFDALLERENIHVICLTRKNSLKQAISKQNMERLLEMQNGDGVKVASCNLVNDVELPAFELNVQRAVEYASELQRNEKSFVETIEPFEKVFHVDYDEMMNDGDRTFERMIEFLGLKQQPLRSFFKKTTPDDLQKAISNYDELVDSVQGTSLSTMLN